VGGNVVAPTFTARHIVSKLANEPKWGCVRLIAATLRSGVWWDERCRMLRVFGRIWRSGCGGGQVVLAQKREDRRT